MAVGPHFGGGGFQHRGPWRHGNFGNQQPFPPFRAQGGFGPMRVCGCCMCSLYVTLLRVALVMRFVLLNLVIRPNTLGVQRCYKVSFAITTVLRTPVDGCADSTGLSTGRCPMRHGFRPNGGLPQGKRPPAKYGEHFYKLENPQECWLCELPIRRCGTGLRGGCSRTKISKTSVFNVLFGTRGICFT